MDSLGNQPTPPQPQSSSPIDTSSNKSSSTRSKTGLLLIIFIIIGGLLGIFLVISQSTKPESTQTLTKKEQTQTPLFLNIESPTDSTLVTDATVVVKGKTLPNTVVSFFTEKDENSTESDPAGNFEGTIKVENGINTLTIVAYGKDGEEKSVTMDVVYDESTQ